MKQIKKNYALILCSALKDKIYYYYEQAFRAVKNRARSDFWENKIRDSEEMLESILKMDWIEE